jgi:hypothetical protein
MLWEGNDMGSTAVFVDRLVNEVPELAEVYRQHLADCGLLLPHVFMGDVTRYVVSQVMSSSPTEPVSRILNLLERGLQSDDQQVKELIGVSFIENLSDEEVALHRLLPQFGEALRREVRSIHGV